MLFFVAAALFGAAVAQSDISSFVTSTTAAGAASSSAAVGGSATSSGPVTHTIAVAKGGHTFEPDVTQAEVGDFIQFEFYPTNHSVVRAEYKFPCIPYEKTGVNKFGFSSGFKPVDAILPNPPKYTIRINDTDPIFFYCSQINSCIGFGMVGVINPNASVSLVTQRKLAEESTFMLNPGEDWPDEHDPFSTTSTTSSSTTSTYSTATAPAATSTSAAPVASHPTLAPGAIAGIAIGGAAVLLAAAVAVYLCGRNSRRQQTAEQVPFSPSVMSYAQPGGISKTMSMHSQYMPPGYVPGHSPQMQTFNPVDPIHAGSEIGQTTSPSPSQNYVGAAPAYNPHQSMYSDHAPSHMVAHEMPAPVESESASLQRRSSISKTGGVERYG